MVLGWTKCSHWIRPQTQHERSLPITDQQLSPGVMNHVVQWVILTGWDGRGRILFSSYTYIYLFYIEGVFSTHKPSEQVGGCVRTCCRGGKHGWLISWFIYLSHPFKTRTEKTHITNDLIRQPVKTFFRAKTVTPLVVRKASGVREWSHHSEICRLLLKEKRSWKKQRRLFQSNTWKGVIQSRQPQVNLQLRMQLKEVKTLLELFSSWVLENVAFRELCIFSVLCALWQADNIDIPYNFQTEIEPVSIWEKRGKGKYNKWKNM